jgi:hypothetical protein
MCYGENGPMKFFETLTAKRGDALRTTLVLKSD